MADGGLWDVVVVGAGPAGLAAAITAARAGARTLVLERSAHPRYKTCGGGLVGASLSVIDGLGLADAVAGVVRDRVDAATFTLRGGRRFTRHTAAAPLVCLVQREEFDTVLCRAAEAAGVTVRQHAPVRAVAQDGVAVTVRLRDGAAVRGRVVVGADGSAGVTGRHVGVHCGQTDLGLEVELPVPHAPRREWRGRVLIDWGPLPGSYGWVFPKGDRLTVGVIAGRGRGESTRAYLAAFLDRLGLSGIEPAVDTGHLTRCRTADSPLRRGRVLVAGDAAGLLEPWTREGISFALRSGVAAGTAAADAALAEAALTEAASAEAALTEAAATTGEVGSVEAATGGGDPVGGRLDRYATQLGRTLLPEMAAGQRLLAAFARHPGTLHAALATPPGWAAFTRFCRSGASFAHAVDRRPVRWAVGALRRW